MTTTHPALTIGVVGAGTMGRGIAQLFVVAGHRVLCHDAMEGAAPKAVDAVGAMLSKLAEKGRLDASALADARARLSASSSLEGLADCDLVVEAIVEDLEVKRSLFHRLEGIVRADAILASNTSSLTISEIAAACARPERVAGLHFFNPVPLMRVAEVIAAPRTAPEVIDKMRVLITATGHRAVVAADQPGFLVNHAGRGLYTEGLRVVEEQAATPAEVDTILREAAGFRMGPFELLDLTGLDVSSRVMSSIYEQFQQEPRFRPSSLVAPRVAAGLFGRKTGEGWYRYENEAKVVPVAPDVPALPSGLSVWIDPLAPEHAQLTEIATMGGAVLARDAMQPGALLLVQPWGGDATSACVALGIDATRTVAIDPLPGLSRHRTLMLTVATSPAMRDAAHALFANDGTGVTVIGDSPGFVVQRVLATVVNIAANIAQRGIASVEDLEDAVRLGLGYPMGPLAWGDRLGARTLLEILRNMQAATGDPRYRPSAWLVRRAELGLPLTTPEASRR
ncbi:MAG: 3-hydroxyacyl-CoA dehydrogenase [Comamonadaceae bacterium]|nr:MAG: 3-hydroxyacyl-CoA dehydrogenase [Comamonadaceae bacterium]